MFPKGSRFRKFFRPETGVAAGAAATVVGGGEEDPSEAPLETDEDESEEGQKKN